MRKYPFLFVLVFAFACQTQPEKPEFKDWLAQNKLTKPRGKAKSMKKSFLSSPLAIDTIFRSMQGPYEIKRIELKEEGEEFLWITGYQSSLIAAESRKEVSSAFMCHNNLNYFDEQKIPWKIKTTGANSRIFTLSEGQTELILPPGFGIPIPNEQSFEMVSQVLNHNLMPINLNIQHQVSLSYIKGSEAQELKPLYQQSVFITKQISGPAGDYGHSKLCLDHHLDSTSIMGMKPNHNCEIDYSGSKYTPYKDLAGRKYTGHWTLPYGKEVLKTEVSRMLDLQHNSRIHAIGVHLHPFGEKLELWDKTSKIKLYEAKVEAQDSLLGFKHIEFYSNEEGIPVFKDHDYELVSTYNCTDSTEKHTAMAVMYLYLAEQ